MSSGSTATIKLGLFHKRGNGSHAVMGCTADRKSVFTKIYRGIQLNIFHYTTQWAFQSIIIHRFVLAFPVKGNFYLCFQFTVCFFSSCIRFRVKKKLFLFSSYCINDVLWLRIIWTLQRKQLQSRPYGNPPWVWFDIITCHELWNE